MDNALCIVLKTADYRDSDKMLTLFAREEGLVSALARGAKNLKNPLAAASQPFCCGIFSFSGKNGKLYVSQCEIKKEFFSLGKDFERYAAACAMVEAAERILAHAGAEEFSRLFVLLANCLASLENGLMARFVLAFFFVQVSDILGVRPATSVCAVCGKPLRDAGFFCAEEGGAVCRECVPGKAKPVRPGDLRMIERMLETEPRSLAYTEGFSPGLLKLMEGYLSTVMELDLRSIKFLL